MNQEKSEWERQLGLKHQEVCADGRSCVCIIDEIKNLLSQEREKIDAEWRKKIESKRIEIKKGKHAGKSFCPQCEDTGYDQALNDMLK